MQLMDDGLYKLLQQGLITPRSEEHTSELQSQSLISYAVFCLKKWISVYMARTAA